MVTQTDAGECQSKAPPHATGARPRKAASVEGSPSVLRQFRALELAHGQPPVLQPGKAPDDLAALPHPAALQGLGAPPGQVGDAGKAFAVALGVREAHDVEIGAFGGVEDAGLYVAG